MPDERTLVRIGEAVDRLISVDVSARGLIGQLYDAARASLDNQPLALTAARRLAEATKPGQTVIVATGLPVRGWFSPAISENDGPVWSSYPGSGALRRPRCRADPDLRRGAGARATCLCPRSRIDHR